MPKNLARSVVALAAVLACLAVAASPASAHTHDATVTGGTLTLVSSTGTTTFPSTLAGTGAGCGSTIVMDVDHTAGTGNITAFTAPTHFIWGGNHYVSTITRTSSTAGSVSQTVTSGSLASLGVSINITIRAAANNSSTNFDCTTTGTPLCTLRTTLALSGTYTHTGTGSLEASNTFSLDSSTGTVTLAIGTCLVPFSVFNGGQATLTDLTGHATT